jgi:23S rRNA pseudouridine1911/1915/1917 synthase
MNIEIIEQTDDYLVLNKPAGFAVHEDGKTDQPTLTAWLLENFPQVKGVGEPLSPEIQKPGIVHRLDKDTSGVIIVALNQKAYEHFKNQFKNREIQKVYHLFAYGNLKEDLIRVDAPIGKDRKDFRRRTTKNPRGKVREAQTDLKVLFRGTTSLKLRSTGKEKDELFVFVEARPKTGRMHQIRVHMKHLNTPLICDSLYAPKREAILGFERLALHAREITFTDLTGDKKTLTAQYPNDFEEAIKVAK